LGFFEERRRNKKDKKNDKMDSDMGSVPDPKRMSLFGPQCKYTRMCVYMLQ